MTTHRVVGSDQDVELTADQCKRLMEAGIIYQCDDCTRWNTHSTVVYHGAQHRDPRHPRLRPGEPGAWLRYRNPGPGP